MRQSVPADTELAVYTHLGEDSSSSLVLKQPNTVLTHTYQITGHARLYPEYPDYPKSTASYSYTAYVSSYFFLLCGQICLRSSQAQKSCPPAHQTFCLREAANQKTLDLKRRGLIFREQIKSSDIESKGDGCCCVCLIKTTSLI